MTRPTTSNATFSATLVDEWVRLGLSHAFIAPGSRSTPLALALSDNESIRLEIFHDERSASFAALGHGLATGRPAVVLCSSGTAATHFHAAVVEASLSCVPLLAVTADRPEELIGVGAPQAIEQTNLYGQAPRLFVEPGCPEDTSSETWRPLADRTWSSAVGTTNAPGPVHLNLAFRGPLDNLPGELPAPVDESLGQRSSVRTRSVALMDEAEQVAKLIDQRSGLIVAGSGLSDPESVAALAGLLNWPLLADQRSGLSSWPGAVTHGDLIARANPISPEVILRIGEQPASKELNQWIDNSGSFIVAATPHGRPIDPADAATISVSEAGLAQAIVSRGVSAKPGQVEAWADAEAEIESAITSHLATHPESELAIAQAITSGLGESTNLVVSSSMPIRQVEWFGGPTKASVYSNRGANGIDGVIATAIGIATSTGPTLCYVGDVAFLHDSTSLIGLARRSIDLTIVVVDNDGGGIFSHLPQASNLPAEQFEQLFGTPHGTDIAALAAAHLIPVETWSEAASSGKLRSPSGIRVVVAKTDRAQSVALQKTLTEQILKRLI